MSSHCRVLNELSYRSNSCPASKDMGTPAPSPDGGTAYSGGTPDDTPGGREPGLAAGCRRRDGSFDRLALLFTVCDVCTRSRAQDMGCTAQSYRNWEAQVPCAAAAASPSLSTSSGTTGRPAAPYSRPRTSQTAARPQSRHSACPPGTAAPRLEALLQSPNVW